MKSTIAGLVLAGVVVVAGTLACTSDPPSPSASPVATAARTPTQPPSSTATPATATPATATPATATPTPPATAHAGDGHAHTVRDGHARDGHAVRDGQHGRTRTGGRMHGMAGVR